jgi:hypothetical protein
VYILQVKTKHPFEFPPGASAVLLSDPLIDSHPTRNKADTNNTASFLT